MIQHHYLDLYLNLATKAGTLMHVHTKRGSQGEMVAGQAEYETNYLSERRQKLSYERKSTHSSTSFTRINVALSSAVFLSTHRIRCSTSILHHGKRPTSKTVLSILPIFSYQTLAGLGIGKHGMSMCLMMLTNKVGNILSASTASTRGMAPTLSSTPLHGEEDG